MEKSQFEQLKQLYRQSTSRTLVLTGLLHDQEELQRFIDDPIARHKPKIMEYIGDEQPHKDTLNLLTNAAKSVSENAERYLNEDASNVLNTVAAYLAQTPPDATSIPRLFHWLAIAKQHSCPSATPRILHQLMQDAQFTISAEFMRQLQATTPPNQALVHQIFMLGQLPSKIASQQWQKLDETARLISEIEQQKTQTIPKTFPPKHLSILTPAVIHAGDIPLFQQLERLSRKDKYTATQINESNIVKALRKQNIKLATYICQKLRVPFFANKYNQIKTICALAQALDATDIFSTLAINPDLDKTAIYDLLKGLINMRDTAQHNDIFDKLVLRYKQTKSPVREQLTNPPLESLLSATMQAASSAKIEILLKHNVDTAYKISHKKQTQPVVFHGSTAAFHTVLNWQWAHEHEHMGKHIGNYLSFMDTQIDKTEPHLIALVEFTLKHQLLKEMERHLRWCKHADKIRALLLHQQLLDPPLKPKQTQTDDPLSAHPLHL